MKKLAIISFLLFISMFYYFNKTPKKLVHQYNEQIPTINLKSPKLKNTLKDVKVTYTQSTNRNIASVQATLVDPETKNVEYKMNIPRGMHLYNEEKMKEIASDFPIDQINREDE